MKLKDGKSVVGLDGVGEVAGGEVNYTRISDTTDTTDTIPSNMLDIDGGLDDAAVRVLSSAPGVRVVCIVHV